jgi:hypothetical protein
MPFNKTTWLRVHNTGMLVYVAFRAFAQERTETDPLHTEIDTRVVMFHARV